MSRSVIVSGARTPMGRLLGSLKDFSAADLGGVAIKAALERAGISGDQVDYVIMGQVLQAGAGQNPARPAAVAGGIPMSVPSFTLNKVCLSGLDAIALADQLIRAGEFEIVVAGGMESMTQAPHLLAQLAHRHQVRRHEAGRLDGPRRPVGHLRPGRHGRAHRAGQRPLRPHPRGAGRVRRRLAPAGRRRAEERPLRRRDRPGAHPAAQGRPDRVPRGRGHPRRHHGREPVQAQAGVRQGRHHHRRHRLADLRRRLRGRGHERGEGRRAGPDPARRDRRARRRRRPGRHPADPAVAGDREGLRARGHRPQGPRPGRDQRGVRRGRHRVHPRARASTRRRSTSTAARSRWATRSA